MLYAIWSNGSYMISFHRIMVAGLGLLILSAVVAPVNAALLDGQTVNATYCFRDLGSEYQNGGNVVVGAGVEYPNFISYFDLDIADASILASNFQSTGDTFSSAGFNGFVITDVNGTIDAF